MPSLIALKNHIKAKKIVNLEALACHFQTESDSLEPMLTMLVNKGYICQRTPATCTKSCTRCGVKVMPVYFWQ